MSKAKYHVGHPSSHSIDPLAENGAGVSSRPALGAEGDVVGDRDGDRVDIGRAVGVVHLDDHLHHLARHEPILPKGHPGDSHSLVDTAATGDRPRRITLLTGNHTRLSENDFPSSHDLELGSERLDGGHHVVDDDSLLGGSVVIEAGGPPLESLEAEGERVLPGRKPTAIVNHALLPGEHVPGLVVGHLIVTIGRSPNVLGPVVVIIVPL
jgi:hypothetical protein